MTFKTGDHVRKIDDPGRTGVVKSFYSHNMSVNENATGFTLYVNPSDWELIPAPKISRRSARGNMVLRIDEETNTARVLFRDAPIEESEEREGGIIFDYDSDGKLVGIEFLNAKEILGDLEDLRRRY